MVDDMVDVENHVLFSLRRWTVGGKYGPPFTNREAALVIYDCQNYAREIGRQWVRTHPIHVRARMRRLAFMVVEEGTQRTVAEGRLLPLAH